MPLVAESANAPATAAPAAAGLAPGRFPITGLAGVSLVLAALTLLLPSTPTYDPWAWLLWGREILHLDLVTTGGPSWKPLPVFFTTLFAVFGANVAPYLWLLVARAGGIFACLMAWRLARRLVGGGIVGAAAGAVAAGALASSYNFARDAALGNSEPLLAGLLLLAVERHLDGRRDHALYLGVAAALLRPEVWPFLALYGLYLWLREPRLRLRLVAFALLVPALWILPEWWGSGDPLRASERATNPNRGSVAFADRPALELARRTGERTPEPVFAAAAVALLATLAGLGKVRRLRRAAGGARGQRVVEMPRAVAGDAALLVLAALGAAWFGLVAAMAERGYAGNQRYLIGTTAVLCVLAGVGVGRILHLVGRVGSVRSSRRAAVVQAATVAVMAAIAAPVVVAKADNVGRVTDRLRYEAQLWADLKRLIARAGGKERLLACGGVFSGPFQTQMVAYELGLHGRDVGWPGTPPPGVLFRTRTVPGGPLVGIPRDRRYREVLRVGLWRIWTVPPQGQPPGPRSCPRRPGQPTAPPPPGGLPFARRTATATTTTLRAWQ